MDIGNLFYYSTNKSTMRIILILVSIALVVGRPKHQRGPDRKGHENKNPVNSSTLAIFGGPCGKVKDTQKMVSSYIVGGEEAAPNSWPWQVSMQYHSSHFCGGSLVRNSAGEMVVVTAAHCVHGSSTGSWTMKLGKHSLSSSESSTSKTVKVTRINKHRWYNSNTLVNDIAVMVLAENNFADTDEISPICLSTAEPSNYVRQDCVVTGWGTLSSGGSSPDRLQQVYKPLLSQHECTAAYGSEFDSKTMVCAGDTEKGGVDACQGDSGGPLACKDPTDNTWKLVGVVSWGIGCGLKEYPGVYANVYNFYVDNWFDNNMH